MLRYWYILFISIFPVDDSNYSSNLSVSSKKYKFFIRSSNHKAFSKTQHTLSAILRNHLPTYDRADKNNPSIFYNQITAALICC